MLRVLTRKASVVDFSSKASGISFLGAAGNGTKGIPKLAEEDEVGNLTLELGVLSDLSSGHVVGFETHGTSGFSENFQETNKGKDLVLGGIRQSVPLFRRGEVSARVRSSRQSQGVWEDEVALHTVSDESGHGDTAVLDLGMTEPCDGLSVSSTPEVLFGELERIIISDDRVQGLSKSLKV